MVARNVEVSGKVFRCVMSQNQKSLAPVFVIRTFSKNETQNSAQ